MKIKFKIISVTMSILISTTCFAQSEGVPQEIQNILIGRWVPTEKVCLQSEFNGTGNLIRIRDNYLSGNYWLLKNEDIKNIEPVLVRKYEITSGRIVDENKKIYEIKGIETDVINDSKFKFVEIFKIVNKFTIITSYIRDNMVLVQTDINKNTYKTNQLVNCESPDLPAKVMSNQLLAKQQEDEKIAKELFEKKQIRLIRQSKIDSKILTISKMSEIELESRRYTLESEKTSSTSLDVSTEIENELQMVNQQLDEIELERKNNRQNQIQNTQRPLTPAELKTYLEVMNLLNKTLNQAFGTSNNANKKNNSGWCVQVRPVENCNVHNIRIVGSSGNFQWSYDCVGRFGYSGSSGVGDINCNNQTQKNTTRYSAQCYKC